jgi:hypothetical protein
MSDLSEECTNVVGVKVIKSIAALGGQGSHRAAEPELREFGTRK